MAHIDDETLTLEEEEWETACEDVAVEEEVDADEVNDETYDDDVDDDDTPAVLPAPVREPEPASERDQPGLRTR